MISAGTTTPEVTPTSSSRLQRSAARSGESGRAGRDLRPLESLYWWPVWLMCFILAGVTYAEGEWSGGVTVSNANGPGMIFVITLLIVTISSTVIFRGLVSVIGAVLLLTLAVTFAWFGWWGQILSLLGGMEIQSMPQGVCALEFLCSLPGWP